MAAAASVQKKVKSKKAGIIIFDAITKKYYLGHSGGDLYLKKYSKWHTSKNKEEKLNELQVSVFKKITKRYNYDDLTKYLKDTYQLKIASDGWVKNSENLPDEYKYRFAELMEQYDKNVNIHITNEGKIRVFNPYIGNRLALKLHPPKGNCEDYDYDNMSCAIREFYEETGVEIPVELLTDATTKHIYGDNITYYMITKQMYDGYGMPELPIGDLPTSELFELNWYSLDEAAKRFKNILNKKRGGGTKKRRKKKKSIKSRRKKKMISLSTIMAY